MGEMRELRESAEICLDLTQLTIGDLESLEAAARGEIHQLVQLVDKVVVGGARHLPLTVLQEIIKKLNEEITELSNPGN